MSSRKTRTSKPAKPAGSSAGGLSAEERKYRKKKKLAVRWGGHLILLDDGFVPVPRSFMRFAAKLTPYPLTMAQQLFVLELMYHKWDANRPYPSYATIAARMGRSVAYIRDVARDLEKRGYLTREVRVGRSNRFDLQPLFDALARHVQLDSEAKQARRAQDLPTEI